MRKDKKRVVTAIGISCYRMRHGERLLKLVNGDARRALNTLEMMARYGGGG